MSPFEWHDGLRCASILISLASIFMLFRAWKRDHKAFDASARDIWYVLLVWSATTILICLDGLFNNLPFGPRSIGVIAASSLTLVVLIRSSRRHYAPLVR